MKNIPWTNIKLLLMFGLVVFLYSFTSKRNEQRKISQTIVKFVGKNDVLVTKEAVNKLLIENKKDAFNLQIEGVDLNELERRINKHAMIERSEVFLSVDGVLNAVVKQKEPIARFVGDDDSFYLDNKGDKIPLSDNFTTRVPLVSGEISSKNSKKIGEFFKMIYQDDFLKENIIGAHILPSGSLILRVRNFDYLVEFGKTIYMEKKFNNYKAFFQKASQDSILSMYKTINLKFTQQVVCTK